MYETIKQNMCNGSITDVELYGMHIRMITSERNILIVKLNFGIIKIIEKSSIKL